MPAEVAALIASNWIQTGAVIAALAIAITGWVRDSNRRRHDLEVLRRAEAQREAWRITWTSYLPNEAEERDNRGNIRISNRSDRPIFNIRVQEARWTTDLGYEHIWKTSNEGWWGLPTLLPGKDVVLYGNWYDIGGSPAYPPADRQEQVEVFLTWTDPEGFRFSSQGPRTPVKDT